MVAAHRPGFVAELSDAAFTALAERVHAATGITVGPSKRQLVYARLGKRVRALGLPSFDAYVTFLDQEPSELSAMISAMTTNLTFFFREPHHFETLAKHLRATPGPKRVWSSACATGEEPYSIAMTAHEAGVTTEVLATDIDEAVVGKARAAVFELARLEPVSLERRRAYFTRGVGPQEGMARVRAEIRAMVELGALNLIGPWPQRAPFDAVFCRNVLIYFDGPTQHRLVSRLIDALKPGGLLFLGHSESVHGLEHRIELLGQTTYRRIS